jgi:hypothetical protein
MVIGKSVEMVHICSFSLQDGMYIFARICENDDVIGGPPLGSEHVLKDRV